MTDPAIPDEDVWDKLLDCKFFAVSPVKALSLSTVVVECFSVISESSVVRVSTRHCGDDSLRAIQNDSVRNRILQRPDRNTVCPFQLDGSGHGRWSHMFLLA